MDLKATIKRFRAWQKDPYTFKCSSTGNHTCANCGNVFEGDFCPVCGQKHDMGRVDWTSVDKELISIWSILDSKTLFSYLMQLFGRPGYLIGDYISGRRQVCSSPVSMLAIVAVIVVVILRLFGEFWAEHTTWEFLSMVGAYILLGVGVMHLACRIGKKTAQGNDGTAAA